MTHRTFARLTPCLLGALAIACGGYGDPVLRDPLPNEVVSATLRLTVAADAPAGAGSLVVRARGRGVADKTATIAVTIQ